jgi:hypothetical protein
VLGIANVAIAVTAAIALAVVLTRHDDAATSPQKNAVAGTVSSRPAVPSDAPELVAWVRANLPSSARIVTDDQAAALLAQAGFQASTDYASCRGDRFVLVTSWLRQRAAAVPTLAGCLASSQVVAAIGSGASATELRAITADPAAATAAREQALSDRRLGGAALTQNPAVSMPDEVRRELLAGRLDLRAETVLVTLARRTAFRIDALQAEAAEAQAGMPARTVALRLPSPPGPGWFRAHLSHDYRPIKIVRRGPDIEWLTWSFQIAPPPVLR